MASVDRNIGGFRSVVENAMKVPSLINIEPYPNPGDQYNRELTYLTETQDSPNSGYFVWGIDQWGSNTKQVAKGS